jgi:benzil reductase ((S)-benzoin forming)
MKTYVITGASRGLGAAVAEKCLEKGNHCIIMARSENMALKVKAEAVGAKLTFTKTDLTDIDNLEKSLHEMFSSFEANDELYVINNAGTVDPIKPVGKIEAEKLLNSTKLNYLAPVMITNSVIAYTKTYSVKKVVVNISSGAAKYPYEGWGVYCSTKSALDMFTRVAALEQKTETHPTSVISFSPGVMDTDMQEVIRSADEQDFAQSARFHEYKEKHLLRTPAFVAGVLLNILNQKLENGKFYDIKNYI